MSHPRPSRLSGLPVVSLSVTLLLLLPLATLQGCAITEEARVPDDYAAGAQAASQAETARAALPAYRRQGADLERQGRLTEAAAAYNNAVSSALALGRLQDALEAGQRAVATAERAQQPRHLAIALKGLGWTYLMLGALDKAVPVFERGALTAKQRLDFQIEAACYDGLGAISRRQGDGDRSLEYSRKAVELLGASLQIAQVDFRGPQRAQRLRHLEWNYAERLAGLGWSHFALGQWDGAQAAFEQALAIGERIGSPKATAQAHQGLGAVAARQRNGPTAVRHLEEAIRIFPRPAMLARSHGILGRVYRAMGKLPEAEAALRKAVAGIEDLRSLLQSEELRESFFEDKAETYELLVLTLLDLGKTAEAFDVGERARARAFLDLLGNRVLLSRGRHEPLLAEERALRERISVLKTLPEDSPALRQELELAREAYQLFLRRVRQADTEQASLMTVEPLRLSQVQALLPDGALLLEYFVTEQGPSILWAVTRQTVAVTRLPIGRQEMAERVQAFRELIASRDRREETARAARALYDALVRPGLRGSPPTELVIVPHGPLHYLPFQALMPASGRYLLQESPLYYYTSASLMQFTRAKRQAGPPTVFAMGNPDVQDRTLSLPYAAREARGIAALFPGAELALGTAATKAASREALRRHSVLHFATHAEFDAADPLGTSLLLASTNEAESRLEVQEIFGLELHASLVVLSACETALGKLTRGDELTGLTRAFIYAGTPSVITTLWQVNDRSAFELMREFYRQLRAGRNKAEALRLAQLAILGLHPDPYHWAAYALTGEPR
jgi:CHAT domain-containing protein